MFTGLVEEVGAVRRITGTSTYKTIEIDCDVVLPGLELGNSVAIDGVCQTVTKVAGGSFSAEILAETLKKTTLGEIRPPAPVNLERAVTPTSRLGGHFVQGHVDAVARITRVTRDGANGYITVRLPHELAPYVVREGSVALNGVSLTIARVTGSEVTANIIPTTWKHTNLGDLSCGHRVNVEVDILGRYVARMLGLEQDRTDRYRTALYEQGRAS